MEDVMRRHLRYAAAIALTAVALGGCQTSSGGTIEVGVTASGQSLTAGDAGATTGPALILDIVRVDVHVAGVDSPDDDDHPGTLAGGGTLGGSKPPGDDKNDDGGWVTVFA